MIKFIITYLKSGALFLLLNASFQGCVIYNSNVYNLKCVTIEEAINKEHNEAKYIKILYANNYTGLYDSIYYKDNLLFGMIIEPARNETIRNGDEVYPAVPEWKHEVHIAENEIEKIYLLTSRNY